MCSRVSCPVSSCAVALAVASHHVQLRLPWRLIMCSRASCGVSSCAVAVPVPSHHVRSRSLCHLIMCTRAHFAVSSCAIALAMPSQHVQSRSLCRLIMCSRACSAVSAINWINRNNTTAIQAKRNAANPSLGHSESFYMAVPPSLEASSTTRISMRGKRPFNPRPFVMKGDHNRDRTHFLDSELHNHNHSTHELMLSACCMDNHSTRTLYDRPCACRPLVLKIQSCFRTILYIDRIPMRRDDAGSLDISGT
jgi:hypothetical protein